MSPRDEVVVSNDVVAVSEIDRVLSVIGKEIFFSIHTRDSVIVGDRYVLESFPFGSVAPALEVLSARVRPSRIQQEVPNDCDVRPSLYFYVGFAIGNHVTLDSQIRGFNGEDSML